MGQLRDRMEQDLKLKGVSPATIVPAPDRAGPRSHLLAPVASPGDAPRLAAPAPSLARARQCHRAGNSPDACPGVGAPDRGHDKSTSTVANVEPGS